MLVKKTKKKRCPCGANALGECPFCNKKSPVKDPGACTYCGDPATKKFRGEPVCAECLKGMPKFKDTEDEVLGPGW